ncbi:uncharacterized protein LOC133332596 [Musca vetustissima]|uniref:uncharacterized protein LOC133332596 n=1 Tax=Musca vetustissima TaxID=27455 RepID=UPI002AB76E96|nr:uncharacterized protein LOC133332596 [Musca vetustissima]
MGICDKVQVGFVRRAAVEETLRSMENKIQEARANHQKSIAHGVNNDSYFQDKVWEQIQAQYERAKKAVEGETETVLKMQEQERQQNSAQMTEDLKLEELEPEQPRSLSGQQFKIVLKQMQAMQEQMQAMQKCQEEILRSSKEQSNQLPSTSERKENETETNLRDKAKPLEQAENPEQTETNRYRLTLSQYRREINKHNEAVEGELMGVNKYALEHMKSSLEKQFDEIQKLNLELSMVHDREDTETDLEEIEEKYEARMYEIIMRMGEVREETMQVELKPIQVPCFGGKVEEWSSFQNLFKEMIDWNSKLSELQKLYYLKTNLRGEAFRIVQHLQITEANYKAAWELLEN